MGSKMNFLSENSKKCSPLKANYFNCIIATVLSCFNKQRQTKGSRFREKLID